MKLFRVFGSIIYPATIIKLFFTVFIAVISVASIFLSIEYLLGNLPLVIEFQIGVVVFHIILLYALFFSIPWRSNILPIMITLLICFYVSELVFIKLSSGAEEVNYLKVAQLNEQKKASHERSLIPLIYAMRARGIDAYPYVYAGQNLAIRQQGAPTHMLGTMRNTLTVLCRESSPYAVFKSDRYGFNNPDSVWNQPADIAIVGDSYVMGSCVPPSRHYSSILRQFFPRLIALGTASAGPLTYLGMIREYAAIAKPKLVLWSHFEGKDTSSRLGTNPALYDEWNNTTLRQYMNRNFSQNLASISDSIDQAMRQVALESFNKALAKTPPDTIARGVELLREFEEGKNTPPPSLAYFDTDPRFKFTWKQLKSLLIFRAFGYRIHAFLNNLPTSKNIVDTWAPFKDPNKNITDDIQRASLRYFRQVLEVAKMDVESWGGKLAILWVPSPPPYRDPTKAETMAIFHDLELDVIDADDTFKNYPFANNILYARNGAQMAAHLSEEGNVLKADLIRRRLQKPPLSTVLSTTR